jgi:hypothetical protein
VRIERERRRSLELGTAGVTASKEPLIFSVAARQYLEANAAHWSASNARIEGFNVKHVTPVFGRLLLSDITADQISRYQADRKKEGAGLDCGTASADYIHLYDGNADTLLASLELIQKTASTILAAIVPVETSGRENRRPIMD